MKILDELKLIPRYSTRYRLPVGHGVSNNPWMELAVAQKILLQNGFELDQAALAQWEMSHWKPDGYLDRWPEDERGGLMSQDELIGASYLSRGNAIRIWEKLTKNFFFYRNTKDKSWPWYKSFQGRFPWALAFYEARATGKVCGLLERAFCLHVDKHASAKYDGATPHLLIFLMESEMRRFRRPAKSLYAWGESLKSQGVTWPRVMLDYFKHEDFWYSKFVKLFL